MAAKKKDVPIVEPAPPRIENVPLDQLEISPLNVRRHAAGGEADAELEASIRAHGLLQPLAGYIAKSGSAIVLICAGGRRLAALRRIVDPQAKIPVRIVDEEIAIEVSLAENLERKDMNPVDELGAFQALVATGHYDANRIADRFGYDRKLVKRRLKMGVLATEILDALEQGKIGLASAEAYAARDDHDLQLKVFKAHSAPNYWKPHEPERILGDYSAAGLSADSGVGKFIGGVTAYEGEGGSLGHDEAFTDLFARAGGEVRLQDPAIVGRLLERAQAAAQDQVEALAKKEIPFASGVEWCDAAGKPPKQGKKSELTLVKEGYTAGAYLDARDVKDLAAKVAEAGGTVHALATINFRGEPEIAKAVLVSKALLEAVRPKKDPGGGYTPPTEEEMAARERARRVSLAACLLLVASLTDAELGKRCRAGLRVWASGEAAAADVRLNFAAGDFAPFVEAAEQELDAAAQRDDEQRAAVEKTLDHLAGSPIDKWPAGVTITVDGDEVRVMKGNGADEPALDCESDGEVWTASDPAQVIEAIRDNIGADSKVTVHMHDSLEAMRAGVVSAEPADA